MLSYNLSKTVSLYSLAYGYMPGCSCNDGHGSFGRETWQMCSIDQSVRRAILMFLVTRIVFAFLEFARFAAMPRSIFSS